MLEIRLMFLLMAINLLGSFLENWVRFLQVCYFVSSDHINVGSYLKQNVKAIRMIWIQLCQGILLME